MGAKQVGGEAMPIRYDLKSICEHPAFNAQKRGDCKKYHGSYCEKHMVKLQEDIGCQKEQEKECLWDMECLPEHVCSDGSCFAKQSCTIEFRPVHCKVKTFGPRKVQTNCKMGGSMYKRGPFFYEDAPMGYVMDVNEFVESATISPGCAEVIWMDAGILNDNCREQSEDNVVMGNRGKDETMTKKLKKGSEYPRICK